MLVCMLDAGVLLLEPSVTRRDSWRGSDTTQEIEFNKININCRVHGEVGGEKFRCRADRARPRGSRSLNIQVHASVKKLFMGSTLRSIRFLP